MVALESYPGIAAIRYHLISTWLSLPGSEAAWAEFLRSTHACRSNTIELRQIQAVMDHQAELALAFG